MPNVDLPDSGQPQVVVRADGERSIAEVDQTLILDLYKSYGALLFRGFRVDTGQFGQFAGSFCSTAVVNESAGRQPVDVIANVYTVDSGVGAFALHPELSREPWKPDVAFFGCLSAPNNGGQTTICDGVALVRELPLAMRDAMTNRRLVYIKPTWPSLLEYWLGTRVPTDEHLASPPPECPYSFERFPQTGIVRIFSRPMLHKPMFVDASAFGNFLLFARFNQGRPDHPVLDDGQPVPEIWLQTLKITGDRQSVAINWQPGDVLMLDNTRFMHGRTAIVDPRERLIMTYFGYLRAAIPDIEEPVNAIWRREDFEPPMRPEHPRFNMQKIQRI